MNNCDRVILVTGATGKQGGAVALRLNAQGWRVRALTRNPRQSKAQALAADGIDIFPGDLDDANSVRRALAGVYGVFSVQSFIEHGPASEVRQGRLLADLALQAGVEHFVYASVGGAERFTGVHHFETKWLIEQHLHAIGLPGTILRPVAFMESFTYPFFLTMICSGILPGTLGTEDRWQLVAVEDIGLIAATVFNERENFLGQTLEIASEALTMTEAAAIFSRVLGRPVAYTRLSPEQLHPWLSTQLDGFARSGGFQANLPMLRARWPDLLTLDAWLRKQGWDRLTDPLAKIEVMI